MEKDKKARRAKYLREYREANKQRIAAYQKQYYIDTKEERLISAREYYCKNKESIAVTHKEYRDKNKANINAQKKVYDSKNSEKIRDRQHYWYKANKETVKLQQQSYLANNADKFRQKRAKRRAAILMRTPTWHCDFNEFALQEIYALAALRTKVTGFNWHVDHIIPLQGKKVSGLHLWTNLQVIPAKQNIAKSNKFEVLA